MCECSRPDERAMEEWRQLQSIIGRHESTEIQVRGWLLVLLGALVAAVFTQGSALPSALFFAAGLVLTVAFCIMELVVRVPKRKAIERAGVVEAALRGEAAYDGPAITRTLSRPYGASTWRDTVLSEFRLTSVWTFYLALLLVIFFIAVSR